MRAPSRPDGDVADTVGNTKTSHCTSFAPQPSQRLPLARDDNANTICHVDAIAGPWRANCSLLFKRMVFFLSCLFQNRSPSRCLSRQFLLASYIYTPRLLFLFCCGHSSGGLSGRQPHNYHR
jgi:hypothetical protein